jgi:putative addiction module component (TIGR02574 family)
MSMADTRIDFSHLTPEQRLDLIAALWDSIPPADAEPISPELARELDRRVAEMDREPEASRPWEEVIADLRKRLG